MDEGDENRTHLLDPVMLDLCGDVSGLTVLDNACGEGRFSRMLRSLGADVFSSDLSRPLIAEARRRQPMSRYARGNSEALPFSSESFDLVTQYLSLIDIKDFRSAIHEMARVARVGGRVVIAVISSIASAVTGTCRDPQGNKLFAFHRYSEERTGWMDMHGVRVLQHHRPLSWVLGAFLESGMTLLQLLEPVPTPQAIKERPRLAECKDMPFFIVMEWRRDR